MVRGAGADRGGRACQATAAFGVNIIPAATDSTLLDAEITTCLALSVSAMTLFWDVQPAVVRRLKDAGVIVVYQIGSLDDAKRAEDAGTDILIAQGREAGGHVRATSACELVTSGAVSLPVLAAGGIVSGRDLAEALSLGAQGVVVGTAFMATHEAFAHDYHKQRLIEARDGDTLLTTDFHINWPEGAMVRVLNNSVTRGCAAIQSLAVAKPSATRRAAPSISSAPTRRSAP
jgi:nitronate monooxygenase